MAPLLALLALAGTVLAQAHGDNDTSATSATGGGHRAVLSSASSRAAAAAGTKAGSSPAAFTPLANLRFTYPDLPYKAQPDSETSDRGPQVGYNICNSTTQNQQSMCQTAWINSIDDFCLWAPPNPGSTVGDVEGEMVAWCTKEGHGSRIIPDGALTGVQFIKTPSYLEVTGHINQQLINMAPDDSGGEMDPHGADARGNPMGGLIFSSTLPKHNGTITQAIEWHNFMGGNLFCIKICDPSAPDAAKLCQHVYDRIGCQYNVPAAYVDGVFESCAGDDQDPVGYYTVGGKTTTYAQPPESLGAITSVPYTAKIPASSQCTQYSSSALYTAAASLAPNSSISTVPTGTLSFAGIGAKVTGSTNSSSTGGNNGAAGQVAVGAGAVIGAAVVAFAALL